MTQELAAVYVDREALARLRDEQWRKGELDWLMDMHQVSTHRLFEAWNVLRKSEAYRELCKRNKATLRKVWSEMIARRWGKTSKWLIVLFSKCIKHPGSVYTYATTEQVAILQIVVKLSDILLETCPEDVKPAFMLSHRDQPQGFFFPNGSVIKLVGLDHNADSIRGQFSDGMVFSEAGFMNNLEYLIRSVVLPQFQRRPWAFLVCETTRPRDPLHDYLRIVVPDAEARNAHIERTIEDNTAISPEEIEEEIAQMGGRGHPTCERELFNADTRDPELLLVPQWRKEHLREWARPSHALCMTAADPGLRDMFGLVLGYYDYLNNKSVMQWSWAERNSETKRVACVIVAAEYWLWGSWPPCRMRDIPLESTDTAAGWVELLARTDVAHLAQLMHKLCKVDERRRPRENIFAAPDHFQYWSGTEFKFNPNTRVSDTEARMICDLETLYGLTFQATRKDDKDAALNNVRAQHSGGHVVYDPKAGPVIAHVKGGRWNDKRTDWARDPLYGHFDCLAAEIYWFRNLDALKAFVPFPPTFTDPHDPKVYLLPTGPKVSQDLQQLSDALSGRLDDF